MYLDTKKQKAKNDWFICTIKCSKNVRVRFLLEAGIINGSTDVFRGFQSPKKLNCWWIFKLNFIIEYTETVLLVIKQ